MIMDIASKKLTIKHIKGPLGVRGRNSDNRLIYRELDWMPTMKLRNGMEITYRWVEEQVKRTRCEVRDKSIFAKATADKLLW
jgi:dTDP-D-glucose 4,6-dehydratase